MCSLLAVAQAAHPGGAETGLLRLAPRLRDRGWDISLAAPGPGPLRDAAAEAGFTVHELPLGGLAAGSGARALASWPKARRLAGDHDVVYLNGTVAGRVLPAMGRARTVLHVHDIVDRVPRFWRRADRVLADSRATAAPLEPDLDPVVVGCPVELDPPSADPPWPAGDGPVIGFVGRIEPRKGPLDLVRAAPSIRAATADARIVVVGDDPFGSDPAYLAAVDSAPGIERYGWNAGAPGLMRHLDVLVAPSRREPFGTVVAEAMAVGTPVVASAVDGLREVVEDGVTGRLVAPGDPEALAAAVLEVLAARDRMGAAARDSARRFDADAYAERLAGLLCPQPASAPSASRGARSEPGVFR